MTDSTNRTGEIRHPAPEPKIEFSTNSEHVIMKIQPLVAWYDFWVGAYWDRKNRKLYLLPIPCIGIVIDFN